MQVQMSMVANSRAQGVSDQSAVTSRYHVPAISRAIDVLEVVASSETTLRLADISREVDIPRASLFSILATLVETGMLERTGAAYGLGPRFADLAGDLGLAPRLARIAYPVLGRLVARYDQSAQVAVLHDGAAQYIAAVESTQTLRVATWVGNRNALDVTAIGSALIVDWGPEELRVMFPSFSEQDIASLADRLAVAKQRGYTSDEGSTELGVLCVGAPIRDENGSVVAALSMSVPEATMSGATVAALPTIVKGAASEVSAALEGISILQQPSPPS